ncbi:MAG: site-specific integrase [Acidobacteria bacterium]|nr:site-specific integrase [Acidobacteriota bacterium]
MKIRDKVFKRKSGKSKDKWIVRIEYLDETTGKTKYIERQADRKGDASDLRNKLINDVRNSHGQVAGIRSIHSVKPQIDNLRLFFGKRLIKDITTESLIDYKLWRLKTKTEQLGRPVKIATVNRALSAMRKMMRFAFSNGWVLKDVFLNAKVIDMSNEIERHRLLTLDEEMRLLRSCQGERQIVYKRKGKEIKATISINNPFLKAIIIIALDSAMRLGEILKLHWQDIDFENNLIRVLATNTKTERERFAPLSRRAKRELEKIKEISPGEKPFPFADIKRSYATAKKLAGIEDLHFHDLRRTAITRWIQQGTPLALAGKLGGHSQLQTTMKHYTANDADSIKEITERMNNFHSQLNEAKQIESELVN